MFLAYVEQSLAPTLKRGDIVIVDNLPAQVAGIQEAIEVIGAKLLYLPPHSPDPNGNGIQQIQGVVAEHGGAPNSRTPAQDRARRQVR
jgi:hypothetical protein